MQPSYCQVTEHLTMEVDNSSLTKRKLLTEEVTEVDRQAKAHKIADPQQHSSPNNRILQRILHRLLSLKENIKQTIIQRITDQRKQTGQMRLRELQTTADSTVGFNSATGKLNHDLFPTCDNIVTTLIQSDSTVSLHNVAGNKNHDSLPTCDQIVTSPMRSGNTSDIPLSRNTPVVEEKCEPSKKDSRPRATPPEMSCSSPALVVSPRLARGTEFSVTHGDEGVVDRSSRVSGTHGEVPVSRTGHVNRRGYELQQQGWIYKPGGTRWSELR
ncbi:uncharacterized protein LOC134536862 isoform X2 [Bacillus rossius redtenbacheri]|uniref:uncharacterized protein LOC134536862 isoform X2 n=1 Tax=Bacillus rossius redtenbacheri TaxID=93214 RepID=UPI002FDD39A3